MNVMVMDVEGTDGRERGEDQDFERNERKSASGFRTQERIVQFGVEGGLVD